METKVFSIRDTKAEIYNFPFSQLTHGEAERTFRELANDPKSKISKYPTDFDLYYLGTYDDQTGKLSLKATPEHLMKAVNCLNNSLTSVNTAG